VQQKAAKSVSQLAGYRSVSGRVWHSTRARTIRPCMALTYTIGSAVCS